MFKNTSIDLDKAGVLNKLVKDYLSREEKLSSFYNFYPDLDGFKKLIQSDPYNDFNRTLLSEILQQQANTVKNTSELSLGKIKLLADKKTFTVTTGHQLCLFTGPLYFIYKIFSTINLAEKLKKEFPENEFVPVYWMATEDHDFAEVNHFHTNGSTVKWESKQTGAVGNFETAELKTVFEEFRKTIGISENSKKLQDLFQNSYLKNKDLASSTRFLVNALFGEYGIVIVDGDDKEFKKQFVNEFKSDIFGHQPFEKISSASKALKEIGYYAQVNGREINCFYLEKGVRTRIETENENFKVVDTDLTFTKKQLEKILDTAPEKISPNVILRPVYQQKILPNLAYVGGPGELAYWLELKEIFDSEKVPFPIIMPRNFFTILEKTIGQKIDKLKIVEEDLFLSETELIKNWQTVSNNLFNLSSEESEIKKIYEAISGKIRQIDQSLTGKVAAEQQKAINGLESTVLKANRAIRRKSETEINQLKHIKQYFSPSGVPQERYENFSKFYLLYGDAFFKAIKSAADPFKFEMVLLRGDY